jgi:fatty-acyl-CoA synthase
LSPIEHFEITSLENRFIKEEGCMKEPSVNYDVLSPVKFLARSAAVYPQKVAVVNGDTRRTYLEFQERVNRLADALKKKGIGKNDKVAFVCPNIPPMLEAQYAVPMIRLSSGEVAYIINHSDAKALFVDNEFAGLIQPVLNQLEKVALFVNICDVSPARPLPGPEYESLLQTGSPDPVPIEIENEREVATINYTSGTTGLPKGVMYHHRGAYLNAIGEILEARLDVNCVYLWTLPMFHCNGWCFTWAVTAIGGTHVCLRAVLPDEVFRLIETEKISHMCAAPTVLVMMSNYPGAKGLTMKRRLEIMTAGAPPAPKVIENVEAMGANITHTYGLTEVFGPHSVCAWKPEWNDLPGEERAKLKSRQGVPFVTTQYMDVVDPATMAPVTRDGQTIGEIVMRGNNVMLGYYKDPQATETAFAGGWFHSGDLAVMHADQYVQIMDRKKDIIISGGENISTVEIENVIFRHPDVLEVAVIPIPDEKWGEVPKAFVVPKENTHPTAEGIIGFCKQNLARFKAPKVVEFAALPKTATGKIQKFKLREKEWQGRERRVN